MYADISSILSKAVDAGASDIFIVAGLPIAWKVNGVQERIGKDCLMPEDTAGIISQIYTLCGRDTSKYLREQVDDDFSFSLPNLGRFRANVFRQRGSLAAVLRVIRFGLPDPQALHIPDAVLSFADQHKGLVLVTGPAGSGKSTTLACLIDVINKTRNEHIVTMEDPIEFVHQHERSIVTQREVPNDTKDYGTALRAALRECPDVILLGEMRDLETIEVAMTAAETGQLLFSTLHTVGAANTVDRIIDVFPPQQQHQVRVQLSMVLVGVISQQLVPTVDEELVPAFEIMTVNPAIRNLIRESKTYQIDSAIMAGTAGDMQTMDDSLLDLCRRGIISQETACRYCIHLDSVEKKLSRR